VNPTLQPEPTETLSFGNTEDTIRAVVEHGGVCHEHIPVGNSAGATGPPGLSLGTEGCGYERRKQRAKEGRVVSTEEGGSESDVEYVYDIPGMDEEAMVQFALEWNGEEGVFLGRLEGRGADGHDELDFWFVDQGILRFSDREARRIATPLYAPDRRRMKARAKKKNCGKSKGKGKAKGGAAQAEQAPSGAGAW